VPWTVIHYKSATLVKVLCLFIHDSFLQSLSWGLNMMLICPAQSYTDHFTSTCGWRQCFVTYSHRKEAE